MENKIWEYEKGFYKAYTEDSEIKSQILEWDKCRLSNQYLHPDKTFGWDFIFPGELYSRVAKVLNLPIKYKNPNRVRAGKVSGQAQYGKSIGELK